MSELISRLGELRVAREASYGVNPGGITRGLLVENFSANPVKPTERVPEIRGKRLHRTVVGGAHQFDVSFMCYLHNIGAPDSGFASYADFLFAIFGTDTVTGAGDPYTHTFSVNDTCSALPSFSLTHKICAFEKTYTGFRPATVTIVIDRGTNVATCEVSGFALTENASTMGAASFCTEQVFTPADANIIIDPGGTPTDLTNYNICTIEYDLLTEVFNALSSQRYATRVIPKGLNMTVTFSGISDPDQQTTVWRSAFLADTKNSSANNKDIDIIINDGTADRQITFKLPEWYTQTPEGYNLSGEDLVPETVVCLGVGTDPTALITSDENGDYDIP